MIKRPLVSIVCLTFNHEEYLEQCLESFFLQEVEFQIEILIHDDASTDGTVDIIDRYKEKYPNVIKPILQTENQFSQGKGFVGLGLCFDLAVGKYIAYCEGDDYWIDSLKLKKQVEFLEANKKFHVCTHDTEIRDSIGSKKNGVLFSKLLYNIFLKEPKQVYTLQDTFTGNIFHISSIMFRNEEVNFPIWVNRFSACDMVLFMLLAKRGDIYYMKDIMSVYRSNLNSVTRTRKEYSSQILFFRMSLNIVRLMNRHFDREYQNAMYQIISRYYVELALVYLRKGNRSVKKAAEMGRLARKYDVRVYYKYSLIGIFNIIKHRLT